MGSLNRVILMGFVGHGPTLRQIPSTKGAVPAARFKVATHEYYTDETGKSQQHTQWHLCECYHSNAITAEKFVRKGEMVTIEGKLHTEEWFDKAGAKQYSTYVKVTTLVLHPKPLTA